MCDLQEVEITSQATSMSAREDVESPIIANTGETQFFAVPLEREQIEPAEQSRHRRVVTINLHIP